MPRTHYALPVDVIRRFDPQITQSNLQDWESSPDAALIGHKDYEKILARLEGVESKWDRKAKPMRPVRVGSREAPIHQSAKGAGFPVHVYLDNRNIRPLDSNAGDFIERRTGRNSWTDITNQEGSAWTADYRKGKLTVYELPGAGHLPALRNHRERFIRLSYRLGTGGTYNSAGQTTLAATLSQGDSSTVSVSDASRLPPSGGLMLVGGSEYVDVERVDHQADELAIGGRAVRDTTESDHTDGTVVHYCPTDVREAIASKAAQELVRYDDWADALVDGGRAVNFERKLDDWEEAWTETVAEYSDNYGYQ